MTRPHIQLRSLAAPIAFIIATAALECSATGAVQYYRFFKSTDYQQTSNSQPTTPAGLFGDVDILFNNPTDFSTASVTTPFTATPLSPITLSPDALPVPARYLFQKGYSTLADLGVDFPNGVVYRYAISGGTLGSLTASLTTPSSDRFASQVPFFSGTVHDHLQGMNAAAPFQFTFSGYTVPIGINGPSIFFAISRVTDGQQVYGSSGNNTQTSVVLPANTLQASTTYDVDLVYSARIETSNAGFGGATSEVAYDLRTDVIFTTAAVPELSSFALLGLGSLGMLVCIRRRLRCRRADLQVPSPGACDVDPQARCGVRPHLHATFRPPAERSPSERSEGGRKACGDFGFAATCCEIRDRKTSN